MAIPKNVAVAMYVVGLGVALGFALMDNMILWIVSFALSAVGAVWMLKHG